MTAKDKRLAILQALEKVLRGRRFDEVTVDEVADAAGVGKGTVYRYFRDKEDLFFQMVQEFLKDEIDAITVVAVSSLAPIEKLVKVGETMGEHIRRHGAYIRMMHDRQFARREPGAHEMMRDHHRRLNVILSQLLRDAEAAGVLRAGLDAEAVLCIYKGMIMERCMRLHQGAADVGLRELVDLVITGLGPTG